MNNVDTISTIISNAICSNQFLTITYIIISNFTNKLNQWDRGAVISFIYYNCYINSWYIGCAINSCCCRIRSCWVCIIIYSNNLFYLNRVSAIICNTVSSCNYFWTSITIWNITFMNNSWIYSTVVRNSSKRGDISCRNISYTLCSYISAGAVPNGFVSSLIVITWSTSIKLPQSSSTL